ncbi:HWE histidine kinase domain-containing protein [Rhizobium sp. CNPSo 3464]|uniref:sensor histidine kinase n=1 Tax=Rhizobium sp. CNPSo 3464 TaxID=3021406 RepID=UPI00254D35A0|nr:HWE histidine kinase domain-containing protein [Rhizobium sp. CNPSo 3464]MDK4743556.1 HWE histidine kinase domain-containing protein [Rhizobium sp. CNPSo 3464]
MNEASNFRLTKRFASYLPRGPVPLPRIIMIAISAVGIASLLRYLMEPAIAGLPFITMFAAVMVASTFGGVYCGLLTTIFAATVSAYAWLPAFNSFALTQQSWIGLAVFLLASALIIAIAHLMHLLVRALRQAESQSDLIAREMKHRISNLLQMTDVLAKQTFKEVDQAQRQVFSQRLLAMAAVLRMSDPVSNRDLRALLRAVLEPVSQNRITLTGPHVEIPPEQAVKLALVFNELMTNSIKYGSLSADGRVNIEWRREADAINLHWKEVGGPVVKVPKQRGFGSQLIERVLGSDEGQATIEFQSNGVACHVVLSINREDGTAWIGP